MSEHYLDQAFKDWGEGIKPMHDIEKIKPLKELVRAMCRAALEHATVPKYVVKGVLAEVSSEIEYK
jgi:hypothetical protein